MSYVSEYLTQAEPVNRWTVQARAEQLRAEVMRPDGLGAEAQDRCRLRRPRQARPRRADGVGPTAQPFPNPSRKREGRGKG